MQTKLVLLTSSLAKVNRQHIQLAFVIISLVMLALGLGAPEDGGGINLK
jgi:hypothetical protein